jgi:hypothetical protein
LALVLGMPETLGQNSDTNLRAEPLRQAQDGAFGKLRTAPSASSGRRLSKSAAAVPFDRLSAHDESSGT